MNETAEHVLSDDEIERFVRDGFLLLRDCIAPELAARLVKETVDERRPPPTVGRNDVERALCPPIEAMDLRDARTWAGRHRLDLNTGRQIPIEQIAPKLWGAIRTLIGERHEIARQEIGEMWILKGRTPEETQGSLSDPSYLSRFGWHIDTPGPATTLDERRDALVLLILWSDCAPGGGGTLYSGQSLDHVVRALEASPAGVDTRDRRWGWSMIGPCDDARELHGRAGDVLITHPFALHAGQNNYHDDMRVLENPTVTVVEPLDYTTDNPKPSPVERAVIARLTRPRPRPTDEGPDAIRYLLAHHDDYALPGRAAWTARSDAESRARVRALDALVTRSWAERVTRKIAADHGGPLSRARAAVSVVRELMANQRDVTVDLRENVHEPDFVETTASRLLRGLVNCEGQNHLLGLLLVPFFRAVYLFDAIDPETGRSPHALVLVEGNLGWFFADAWSDHALFWVREREEPGWGEVPEHGALVRERPDDGLHDRAMYARGQPVQPRLEWPVVADDTRAWLREHASDPSARQESAWRAFLEVRGRHIEGNPSTHRMYEALATGGGLAGLTRRLALALARKQGPTESRGWPQRT